MAAGSAGPDVSRYDGGAALERAAKKLLEGSGYYVVRSAGSKGVADMVALKPDEVVLVQCKTDGYLSPGERVAFRGLCVRLGAVCVVGWWERTGPRGGRSAAFLELTSMGPAGFRSWIPDHGLEVPA